MREFSELEKKLKVKFKNKDLLTQAFVHRSYINESPNLGFSHNERLEFLGDAVLELIVTEYLFKKYPEKTEGELTSWRAALVNANMLSDIAQRLEFNDFLLLSKGESKEEGKARQFILANTIEAFIGSLYLDRGIKDCEKFITSFVLSELPRVIEEKLFRDAKSLFQEKAQEKVRITPTYKVLEESGPDHEKNFVVGVFLGEELIARGEGLSKQEGEEKAASQALEIKKW
jgi:ribonuclease-3